ncbi:hypothetical protein [Mycobacteroides chelonae]|uniref:hypothetical protein n=1 Tax=Mycobacteroides chelonae TaxID=1774 RepID=UPI0018B086D6|nr:hypothetical protein [Mycobacteroides chelonae]MBF9519512.1 hypothetical protein [Mycobacteroides chelonae]
MSTLAMARAIQDLALEKGASCASVTVYGGLVRTVAHLLGESDADLDEFPDDAVLQAARREVPADVIAEMVTFILSDWGDPADAGAVLDQLDELEDPFPVASTAELAYRAAAEELACRNGECAAVVAYAGGQARARWLRLYGGRVLASLDELATDPVLQAARRQLSDTEKVRVTDWVHGSAWEQIDELATERAS